MQREWPGIVREVEHEVAECGGSGAVSWRRGGVRREGRGIVAEFGGCDRVSWRGTMTVAWGDEVEHEVAECGGSGAVSSEAGRAEGRRA